MLGVTIPLEIANVVDTKMATVIGKDDVVVSTIDIYYQLFMHMVLIT